MTRSGKIGGHQLRPLFDQVVIKELDQNRVAAPTGGPAGNPRAAAGVWVEVDEERLLVCRVTQLLGVLESASLDAS